MEKLGRVGLQRLVQEQPAEVLTSPEYFPAARTAPTMIGRCEIKQVERTSKCPIAAIGSAGNVGLYGALHLAPNVGKLLDKGECLPASGSKIGMRRG